jgi:hypothetical protein
MTRLHRQSIFLVPIALLYLPSYAIAVGPPTVLTFDEYSIDIQVPIPAGYGGVSWAFNMGIYGRPEPPWYPKSGLNRVLFNVHQESGVTESIVTFIGGPKIFDGAYFSGRKNVQFKLYSGETLVGESNVLTLSLDLNSGSGPTFLPSSYAGPVDKVGIVGERGQLVMDNFTFEQVPEPSTLLLLGIGAVSLLGRRKSKPVRRHR